MPERGEEVKHMGIHQIVSVVAGGYSVRSIDLTKLPGTVIAVNDSALHLPRVDRVVSMDRLWTENRAEWLMEQKLPTHLRRGTIPLDLLEKTWVRPYWCDNKSVHFGPSDAHLNGTNSGYCALNLAYTLRPDELYLFGFDMQRGPNNEAHWYPDYPWNPKASSSGKLNEWARQFDVIAEAFTRMRTKVFNVSDRTLIRHFKVKRPAELGVAA
jgi:hypothetical protein